jgi:site-specific DNA-adenine methylase
MAKTIVSLLPKTGNTYIEPFAGRGSVFWLAATHLDYQRWWLNDLRTAPFFRAVLSVGGMLQVPPRTKAEYYRQWEAFKGGDATAILLEPYLTFAGGGYGKGGFGGKRTASQTSYQRIIRECHRIMKVMSPKITSLDWSETLKGLGKDDTVFLDPPYLDGNVRAYRADDVDHEALVRVLVKAKFRWVLSGYAHPVYAPLGKPCHREEVQLRTANCDRVRERRQECLWKNF